MPKRNADKVLPEPVGDTLRPLEPPAIWGHPSACGGVGSAKVVSNHVRTGREKCSSGEDDTPITVVLAGGKTQFERVERLSRTHLGLFRRSSVLPGHRCFGRTVLFT